MPYYEFHNVEGCLTCAARRQSGTLFRSGGKIDPFEKRGDNPCGMREGTRGSAAVGGYPAAESNEKKIEREREYPRI